MVVDVDVASPDARFEQCDTPRSREAVEVMLRAFHADPTCGFIFDRTSSAYERCLRLFFETGNQDHINSGQPIFAAFQGNRLVGAAYVREPSHNITPWNLLRWLVSTGKFGCVYRLARYFLGVERLAPREQHYVLLLIGVDPDVQGQRYGTRLMQEVHSFCDARPAPGGIVLDTGNDRNVPFYHSLGYLEIGACQLRDVRQRVMVRKL